MANDIATVVLTCRIAADPKVISPKLMALRVAWNAWNGEEEAGCFADVKLLGDRWQKGIQQYLAKGARIALTGDLREETWGADGGKRSKLVILARDVVLMGGKSDGDAPRSQAPTPRPAAPAPADSMDW